MTHYMDSSLKSKHKELLKNRQKNEPFGNTQVKQTQHEENMCP